MGCLKLTYNSENRPLKVVKGFSFSTEKVGVGEYVYGFNGKEKDNDIASENYDYGARIYDARIGRWLATDAFEFMYTSLSPYNFVANNPISNYDPDGNLILFVNGLTNVGGYKMLSSGKAYWGRATVRYAQAVLNDKNVDPMYINGEYGENTDMSAVSTASERFESGKKYAEQHFEEIINQFKAEKEKDPNATLKIVSHSQGGAFSEGIADYLASKGYPIEIAIHLQSSSAAFVPQNEKAIKLRIAFYTRGDLVANKFGERYKHANISIEESNSSDFYGVNHSITMKGKKLNVTHNNGHYNAKQAHGANWLRPMQIWSTIRTGLKYYNRIGGHGSSERKPNIPDKKGGDGKDREGGYE